MRWKKGVSLGKKLIIYDLKNGTRNNLAQIGIFMLIIIIINLLGARQITDFEHRCHLNATVLDYICFVAGGPKHIPDNMLSMYVIPVLWLLPQVMIAYIIGYYAMTDLDRYGLQVLIRSDSRIRWWISKCIWNSITVIGLYILLYGITILVACFNGAEKTFRLTPEIVMSLCNISNVNGSVIVHRWILLLMPILVSVSLSVFQMLFALIFSPIIGFIVSQSIVFLATIFEYKILFVNYGMLSHYRLTCGSPIILRDGLLICPLLYIGSVIAGTLFFNHYDILPKQGD